MQPVLMPFAFCSSTILSKWTKRVIKPRSRSFSRTLHLQGSNVVNNAQAGVTKKLKICISVRAFRGPVCDWQFISCFVSSSKVLADCRRKVANPAGMSRCCTWSKRKGSSESHRIVIRETSVSNLNVHTGKAMGKYQVQDMTMNVRRTMYPLRKAKGIHKITKILRLRLTRTTDVDVKITKQ